MAAGTFSEEERDLCLRSKGMKYSHGLPLHSAMDSMAETLTTTQQPQDMEGESTRKCFPTSHLQPGKGDRSVARGIRRLKL